MSSDVGFARFFYAYRGDREFPDIDADKETSTFIINASCPIGEMVDFLKANPAFSMNDLMWNLSVPFVRIMMADATQVLYLSEEEKKKLKSRRVRSNSKVTADPDEFARALGIPTF